MSIKPESTEIWVSRLFAKIEILFDRAWQETSYQKLTADIEKFSSTKIQVIIRGATHYPYIIFRECVNQ